MIPYAVQIMAYTVKKLAEVSGVSVRTLHFYDEIGLLAPAYVGDNGYRYYEEEQLLMLQQILFFREIGFELKQIRDVLNQSDFDKLQALKTHRQVLAGKQQRLQELMHTIDKTIEQLSGGKKMKDEELYYGFDSEKQKEHEKYLVESGILTQDFLDESNKKTKHWSAVEKNLFIQELEKLMQGLITAMQNKTPPSAKEVQQLMKKHYHWLELSWTPTKESYIGLIQLYQTPEFAEFYNDRHPQLLGFMIEAMKEFADRELK